MNLRKLKNQAGFTLVELIVVIAIMAILAGVAVPVYSGYIEKANKAADLQLLGAVNSAFAAAAVENGEDVYTIEQKPTIGSYTAPIKINHEYSDDFDRYFAGNEAAGFKVIKNLLFVNGVFVDPTSGNVEGVTYEEVTRADWESAEEGKYLRFKFADISAKEMTDEVEVKIFHSDGTQVSTDFSETVQRYTIRTLDNPDNAEKTKLKTALIDMLNYGAGAQAHFNYNTGVPANVDPEGSTTIADAVEAGYVSTGEVTYVDDLAKGTNMKAVSVSAKNKLMLTFYFAFENDPTTSGYTAYYSYVDHDGVQRSGSTSKFVKHKGSGYYYVDIEGLSIIDGGSLVTCEVKDSSQNVVGKGAISIEGYVSRNTKYNGDVFQMLMRFVDSAYAYFVP